MRASTFFGLLLCCIIGAGIGLVTAHASVDHMITVGKGQGPGWTKALLGEADPRVLLLELEKDQKAVNANKQGPIYAVMEKLLPVVVGTDLEEKVTSKLCEPKVIQETGGMWFASIVLAFFGVMIIVGIMDSRGAYFWD